MKKIMGVVVMLVLVQSFVFAEEKEITSREDCLKQKGIWGRFGMIGKEQCNLPTEDSGKVCKNNNECDGTCIVDLNEEEKQSVMSGGRVEKDGHCSEYQFNFGCRPLIRNGITDSILCTD